MAKVTGVLFQASEEVRPCSPEVFSSDKIGTGVTLCSATRKQSKHEAQPRAVCVLRSAGPGLARLLQVLFCFLKVVLDSTDRREYRILVFLFLTDCTLYDKLQAHTSVPLTLFCSFQWLYHTVFIHSSVVGNLEHIYNTICKINS